MRPVLKGGIVRCVVTLAPLLLAALLAVPEAGATSSCPDSVYPVSYGPTGTVSEKITEGGMSLSASFVSVSPECEFLVPYPNSNETVSVNGHNLAPNQSDSYYFAFPDLHSVDITAWVPHTRSLDTGQTQLADRLPFSYLVPGRNEVIVRVRIDDGATGTMPWSRPLIWSFEYLVDSSPNLPAPPTATITPPVISTGCNGIASLRATAAIQVQQGSTQIGRSIDTGCVAAPLPVTTPAYGHEARLGPDDDADGFPAWLELRRRTTTLDEWGGVTHAEQPPGAIPLDPDDGNPYNPNTLHDADHDGVPDSTEASLCAQENPFFESDGTCDGPDYSPPTPQGILNDVDRLT